MLNRRKVVKADRYQVKDAKTLKIERAMFIGTIV